MKVTNQWNTWVIIYFSKGGQCKKWNRLVYNMNQPRYSLWFKRTNIGGKRIWNRIMFKFNIKLNHNKELLSVIREKYYLLKIAKETQTNRLFQRIVPQRLLYYTLPSTALPSYERKMSGFTSLTNLRILEIPSKIWRKRKHKREGDWILHII